MTFTMREALKLIADCGCERSTQGWCGDGVEDWTPDAEFLDDKWCNPCIAKAALDFDASPVDHRDSPYHRDHKLYRIG